MLKLHLITPGACQHAVHLGSFFFFFFFFCIQPLENVKKNRLKGKKKEKEEEKEDQEEGESW